MKSDVNQPDNLNAMQRIILLLFFSVIKKPLAGWLIYNLCMPTLMPIDAKWRRTFVPACLYAADVVDIQRYAVDRFALRSIKIQKEPFPQLSCSPIRSHASDAYQGIYRNIGGKRRENNARLKIDFDVYLSLLLYTKQEENVQCYDASNVHHLLIGYWQCVYVFNPLEPDKKYVKEFIHCFARQTKCANSSLQIVWARVGVVEGCLVLFFSSTQCVLNSLNVGNCG